MPKQNSLTKKFKLGLCIFRRDLRVQDNPALSSALLSCEQVLAIYDHAIDLRRPLGVNQQWWLGESLPELQQSLNALGVELLFSHKSLDWLDAAKKLQADALFWNHLYLKDVYAKDQEAKNQLEKAGINAFAFQASLIFNPWEFANKSGNPFRVFTPFYKELISRYQAPKIAEAFQSNISTVGITCPANLQIKSLFDGVAAPESVQKHWQPGEAAAYKVLQNFCSKKLEDYLAQRDILAASATSKLSPYLHFGQISPTQIILKIQKTSASASASGFLRQLVWREFAWHLLFHFPEIETENFDRKFDNFAWTSDAQKLACWQTAQTGYPLVDAAMRELSESGIMHNRARMVVASFLAKDLMQNWRAGEAWFWQHLVDADEANNVIGWQWTAGCGPDPAPFFRIFNPVLQSEKFDASGQYIKHWLPQLAKLEKKYLHEPWEASAEILARAGIVLGKNYPRPVVDHGLVAKNALAMYKKIT